MVSPKSSNRLPLEAWDTESLRLTVFPIPASPVEDVGWWQSLMGEPPEAEVIRHREGGRRAEGAFETGRLILETLPLRLDLRLIPSLTLEAASVGFPAIGKFSKMLTRFAEVANRWLNLDSFPEIQRIAFGAVLLASVDSRASGYRQLAAYLPSIDIDPKHSTDFLYQINRPRESASGVTNIIINRLAKWSVAGVSRTDFVLGATQTMYRDVIQQHFACRVELDINTTEERREPLDRSKVPAILSELIVLGKEIVIKGDIP